MTPPFALQRTVSILGLLILGSLSNPAGAWSAQDPRLNDIAQVIETGDPEAVSRTLSMSDWTKRVLQGLSAKERRQLAQRVRRAKSREIREGHLEQYRVSWRSRDLADSEFIVAFSMNARPGDLTKPIAAFSSRPEKIPELLADALEEGDLPLLVSFYPPLSPSVDVLPKLTAAARKNKVAFFRSLKPLETREDERVFKGPYLTPEGLLTQDRLRLLRSIDGRWQAE